MKSVCSLTLENSKRKNMNYPVFLITTLSTLYQMQAEAFVSTIRNRTTATALERSNMAYDSENEYDWFKNLFGFSETTYDDTKSKLLVTQKQNPKTGLSEGWLSSSAKPGTQWSIGRFHYPTLAELRTKTREVLEEVNNDDDDDDEKCSTKSKLTFHAFSGDIREIHGIERNRFATIQVASQFNCLEFVGPSVTPEYGVTGYSDDMTQGPACCSCTSPAVVYRNYMHHYEDGVIAQTKSNPTDEMKRKSSSTRTSSSSSNSNSKASYLTGQTEYRQADMLADFSRAIGNIPTDNSSSKGGPVFWDMIGGYVMSDSKRLKMIPWNEFLDEDDDGNNKYDELMETIRIGVHDDIQVTHCDGFGSKSMQDKDIRVTHCLSSAVPVTYNSHLTSTSDWERLARIILKASYESVFHAAILNMMRHSGEAGSRKIFLTSVGGGVFGNRSSWINDAIVHCCTKFKDLDLEVYLVCYGQVDVGVKKMEAKINEILGSNEHE